jgi:hypothetical protein
MRITKKKNRMLLAGAFGMILVLASWTGCASFKINEGSVTEETITLKSVDLAPLIAEQVRTWQPGGPGFITPPEKPGLEELLSLAHEWGYSEDLSAPFSITVTGPDDYKDSLPYPQAKVSRFTATSKKATREGVTIESKVEYPVIYRVAEVTEGKAVMPERNLALFLTQAEADAYAEKIRPGVAAGISIEVKSYTQIKILTLTLFKPL